MDELRLARALESLVGGSLASDIAADFCKLRRDVATGTLERSCAGKFVESFVQCLQQVSTGSYTAAPSVDDYLNNKVEGNTALPDGLRLCGARIARSIYTMRNKRSIAHKGDVDPNTIDLTFSYHAAAWIITELIRCASGVTMEEAGRVIRLVNAPIGTLVEEIDGVRMVHARVSMRVEILILLHSVHPDPAILSDLIQWVGKSPSATRARLSELRTDRLIVGSGTKGYRLTSPGFAEAAEQVLRLHQAEA